MSAFVSLVVSIAIAISCTTSYRHPIWHDAVAAAESYEELPARRGRRRFAAREGTTSLLSMLASSSNRPPLLGEEAVCVGALYFAAPESPGYISPGWAPHPRRTLPSINTLAESLPITLSGPPAPPMRGRHVYRGGRGVGFNVSTWRPETALATKPRVEAPLPAIYESETPVSMANMMMSRHAYRAPSSTPRRSPSAPAPSSPRVHAFRPPSPESESEPHAQHARSVSV
ncbi:hypothetical protein C8R45DRAFT_1223110 [Mycena sanguinolenta]|nr:hypothetical protein C8R45DRAFT_1223110 [Mycena sanguinolenta]